jgi:hypothetical protein
MTKTWLRYISLAFLWLLAAINVAGVAQIFINDGISGTTMGQWVFVVFATLLSVILPILCHLGGGRYILIVSVVVAVCYLSARIIEWNSIDQMSIIIRQFIQQAVFAIGTIAAARLSRKTKTV